MGKMSTFINTLFLLMWLITTSEQSAVHERIMEGQTVSDPSEYGGYGVHIITEQYTKKGKTYTASACGGTLMSPRVIVSAQHCFVDPDTLMHAKEATFYINTTAYRAETGGIIVSCKGCWDNYPGYIGPKNGSQGDLTVVTLPKAISVKNIKLPKLPPKDKTIKDYADKMALIVGWGRDEDGDQPQTLREVKMPIASYQYCQVEQHNIVDHICAKNINNHTACSGDSGGGAIVNGALIGIASFIFPSPTSLEEVCFEVKYLALTTLLDKRYRHFVEKRLKEAKKNG